MHVAAPSVTMKKWIFIVVATLLGGCGASPSNPSGGQTVSGLVGSEAELKAINKKWVAPPDLTLELTNAKLATPFVGEFKSGKTTCSTNKTLTFSNGYFFLSTEGTSALAWPRPSVDCRGKDVGLCNRLTLQADSESRMAAEIRCRAIFFNQKLRLISNSLLEVCDSSGDCQTLAGFEEPPKAAATRTSVFHGYALNLTDRITYRGLEDVSPAPLVTPVVGVPRMFLRVFDLASTLNTVSIEFEDGTGYTLVELGAVEGTQQSVTNSFEEIFSDSHLTILVSGAVSQLGLSDLRAEAKYRVRRSGETQCLPVNCSLNSIELPLSSCFPSQADFASFKASRVNECKSYMSGTQPGVKSLGYIYPSQDPYGNGNVPRLYGYY